MKIVVRKITCISNSMNVSTPLPMIERIELRFESAYYLYGILSACHKA